MITKKQEMLRYIDSNMTKYATKEFIVEDALGNSHTLNIPKKDLISAIIRNFNDDCQGKLGYDDPVIEIIKYKIV
jgi:hypothetical protein